MYNVFINYDPGMTSTYFEGRGGTIKMSFEGDNLQGMGIWTEDT